MPLRHAVQHNKEIDSNQQPILNACSRKMQQCFARTCSKNPHWHTA